MADGSTAGAVDGGPAGNALRSPEWARYLRARWKLGVIKQDYAVQIERHIENTVSIMTFISKYYYYMVLYFKKESLSLLHFTSFTRVGSQKHNYQDIYKLKHILIACLTCCKKVQWFTLQLHQLSDDMRQIYDYIHTCTNTDLFHSWF